jgi:hypothetical protein
MNVTRKQEDSFTSRERDCCSTISDVLWIIHLFRRGSRDDNFERGSKENVKIITARNWGLEIPTSDVGGDGNY